MPGAAIISGNNNNKLQNTIMQRKAALILVLATALLLCACKGKDDLEKPTPPDNTSITSENEAPGGFSDEGPASWDE